ncbi:MAG: 16S rRNA (cytosine(1402)-N(4))-methyltransferase RsmH [Elusimicrobia bacterium]|nr:16S rRNA (cytosine(1402)-N(4))-methyltransferase RsmH [Elusimicrobiota bacterium]
MICVAVVVRSGTALLVRAPGSALWSFPSGALAAGEDPVSGASRILHAAVGVSGAPGVELGRSGSSVAVLIKSFAGVLAPAGLETSWVESRRLLERPLEPAILPFAELVAAHRRRDRYTGTHPKAFGEKYKELAGDPAAMAKAAARGSTPAGAHLSIMVPEILQALSPLSGACILDCTLGYGGHAAALAQAAGPSGMVIGLDRDGEELARTTERLAALGLPLIARQSDYAHALAVLNKEGLTGVDALLADLGVSSMQLDRPERGMSFKSDGPLDMRMDRSKGKTAAEWIAAATEAQIVEVLTLYGDEPDAVMIAAVLKKKVPRTTRELSLAVAAAKGLTPDQLKKKDAFTKHPSVRVFQALRIAVNDERASLSRLLADLPKLLRPGGRLALLTFHSGEERLVEKALREQAGVWRGPLAAPRRASAEEVRLNPRARSARLWTALRS